MSICLLFVILINPNPQVTIHIFIHITYASSDSKDKPVHTRKLARAFAASTYNVHEARVKY